MGKLKTDAISTGTVLCTEILAAIRERMYIPGLHSETTHYVHTHTQLCLYQTHLAHIQCVVVKNASIWFIMYHNLINRQPAWRRQT